MHALAQTVARQVEPDASTLPESPDGRLVAHGFGSLWGALMCARGR